MRTASRIILVCSSCLAAIGLLSCGNDDGIGPCDGGDGPIPPCGIEPGVIEASVTMNGVQPDEDGCLVSVVDHQSAILHDGDVHTFHGLEVGTYTVIIQGVASNCTVDGGTVRTVDVASYEITTVAFALSCPGPPSLVVSTETIGSVPDPDGYWLTAGGIDLGPIGLDEVATFDAPSEEFQLALGSLSDNCGVHGENPIAVALDENGLGRVDFRVSCPPFYDWIVYGGWRPDSAGNYIIRPDGSDETWLVPDGVAFPVWSPDATRIAGFKHAPDNVSCSMEDLYVIDTADLSEQRITTDAGATVVSWSPDGTKLAYVSNCGEVRGDTWGDLYTVNADGSDPVNLTPGPAVGGEPSWSPDGTLIAFTNENEIWTIRPDGSDRRLLLNTPGLVNEPAWSPDGSQIAFSRWGPGESADTNIWVVAADGSTSTRLTEDAPAYQASRPSWSPDGSQITYWAFRPSDGHSYQIYVMNSDGSSPTRLTYEGVSTDPWWSAGGP